MQRYLNAEKVPQLFVSSGAARFNDSKNSPWCTLGLPDIQRTRTMILEKTMLKGVREGLGPANQTLLVADSAYEVGQPTIDSQIVTIKSSGAEAFINLSTGRATVQSIKRMNEIGWKPIHIVNGAFGTIYETFAQSDWTSAKESIRVPS